jgi:hypothetical protein
MSYIMVVSFIGEGEQEYPEKTTEVTSRIRNNLHHVFLYYEEHLFFIYQ